MGKMNETIKCSKAQFIHYAPYLYMQISTDKIRDVIGRRVINRIINETGVDINIEPTAKYLSLR